MRKIYIIPLVAFLSLSAGCAWTTARTIDATEADFFGGFVYYECKPLIALTGSQISVIYVKNPNKAYAVRFGAFLAKNDVELTFDRDCGLTTVKSKIDTTDILELLQSALDKVAPDLKEVAGTSSNSAVAQLYEIVFDEEGNIERLKPLLSQDLVHIPQSDG